MPAIGSGISPAFTARGRRYLLYDKFLTNRTAGQVNNTLAEPGGVGTTAQRTRTVLDTAGNITIASGELLVAGAITAIDDPRHTYGPFTRVPGLTWSARLYWTASRGTFGWNSAVTVGGAAAVNQVGVTTPSGQLTVVPPGVTGFTRFAAANYYLLQATLFATGGALWAQDGGGSYLYASPTLLWVNEFLTNTPVYALLNCNSATQAHDFKVDWVKVYVGPYTTPQSIAAVYIDNPATGVNYTAVADALHYLTFAQPGSPAAGNKIELRYRYQDADNYWTAYIEYTGAAWDFKLDEVVATVVTNKISVAGVGSVTGLGVVATGNTHDVFTRTGASTGWTKRGGTITDADLNTAVEVGAWYNAGTVSRLSSYPRTFGGSIT